MTTTQKSRQSLSPGLVPMAVITWVGTLEKVEERFQHLADPERRSLNQQAILLPGPCRGTDGI